MSKMITEQNLRALVDLLVKAGTRVIGPKQAGSMVLYEPLVRGNDIVFGAIPRRSAKETFFPLCENILSFSKDADGLKLVDPDMTQLPETVLVGTLPCDAAAAPILDSVFTWDYNDEFFLERRRKTTVIGMGCTAGDDACFCTSVGFSPSSTDGSDLFLNSLPSGGYQCEVLTDKGGDLVKKYPQLFTDTAGSAAASPAPGEKLDLLKVKGWLDDNFENDLWKEIAERCVGCGACAFVCPACHCFDIVDEGTSEKGCRRKFWDACGFGKFTDHASGHNPRDVQPQRLRNRVMHKFKYYSDKFDKTLCTGCGRCIRVCPVGIDIVAVLKEIERQG